MTKRQDNLKTDSSESRTSASTFTELFFPLVPILVVLFITFIGAYFALKYEYKNKIKNAQITYKVCNKHNNKCLCLCSADGISFEPIEKIEGITKDAKFISGYKLYRKCLIVQKEPIQDGNFFCPTSSCKKEGFVSNLLYPVVKTPENCGVKELPRLSYYKYFVSDGKNFLPARFCSEVITN